MSRVNIVSNGPRGRIHVDDHDLTNVVTTVEIVHGGGVPPVVVLTLTPTAVQFDSTHADVTVGDGTWRLLTTLGWTPPADLEESA